MIITFVSPFRASCKPSQMLPSHPAVRQSLSSTLCFVRRTCWTWQVLDQVGSQVTDFVSPTDVFCLPLHSLLPSLDDVSKFHLVTSQHPFPWKQPLPSQPQLDTYIYLILDIVYPAETARTNWLDASWHVFVISPHLSWESRFRLWACWELLVVSVGPVVYGRESVLVRWEVVRLVGRERSPCFSYLPIRFHSQRHFD